MANNNTGNQTEKASSKPSAASRSSSLPPLGTDLKNKSSASQTSIADSFKLDPTDQKKVGNKKWIHLGLILIPLGLLFSIIILLWAFFLNNQEGDINEQNLPLEDNEVITALPPQPIIEDDGAKTGPLKEYFSRVSTNWKDEYIAKVPEATAEKYQEYLDALEENDANLKESAIDFYTYLNNPGILESDEGFILFLNDVREDLESSIGGSLFF